LFFTTAVSVCDRLGQVDFNACHLIGAHVAIGLTRQGSATPNDATARGQHCKGNTLVVCGLMFSIFYPELQPWPLLCTGFFQTAWPNQQDRTHRDFSKTTQP
jgi:hypothetical protein